MPEIIDGFESLYGMGLLATVDWLINGENTASTVKAICDDMEEGGSIDWPAGNGWNEKGNPSIER